MQLQTILDNPAIDTLVHLGAGQCRELDNYLALQCRRVILVEADLQLADALHTRTGTLSQVQIINAAVAGKTGPAVLHRFSMPDVNSLHTATGLYEIFPGLKEIDQLQVEAISPVLLLAPLQLHAGEVNRLIIDIPGEELSVLQALQGAQQLHHFREIYLYCGFKSLYKGCEPAATILRWLEEHGFDTISEDDSQDPDRPLWILQRNSYLLHNLELREQIHSLQIKLEQIKLVYTNEASRAAQLQRLAAENEQANIGLQQQLEQLVHDLIEVQKQADERQKQADEREKQLDALINERNQLLAVRQAQIEQLMHARDQTVKVAADLQAEVEQVSKERDEQIVLAQQRQERVTQLESQLAETQVRQKLLNEEMIKVEGQVDLIKDIVLRGASV